MIKSIGNANEPSAVGGVPSPMPAAGNSLSQAKVIPAKKATGTDARTRVEGGAISQSPLAGACVIQPRSATGDDNSSASVPR